MSFLSWGTKRIKLGDTYEVLPAITRRRSKKNTYEGYVDNIASGEKLLSASTFYRIISAITAGDTKLRKAVDYVVGFLVDDPFELLKNVVSTLAYIDVEKLLADMEVVRAYLKYGFDYRVREQPKKCRLHSIEYGLAPPNFVLNDDSLSNTICMDCKRLFHFYDNIKLFLTSSSAHASATDIVDASSEKARLFLGHRLRVVNQQKAIAQLIEDMQKRCLESKWSDECVITLDFKMKLEPMYFREKTVDHYGKRGMSWHGALVQYFVYDESDTSVTEERLYYDHISTGDTKQDRESTISMIEAVLLRLSKDLRDVKKIVFISDNATCYQNTLIPLLLPFLSFVYKVEITRYLHTETQDGKSTLDAHFARAMQVRMNELFRILLSRLLPNRDTLFVLVQFRY